MRASRTSAEARAASAFLGLGRAGEEVGDCPQKKDAPPGFQLQGAGAARWGINHITLVADRTAKSARGSSAALCARGIRSTLGCLDAPPGELWLSLLFGALRTSPDKERAAYEAFAPKRCGFRGIPPQGVSGPGLGFGQRTAALTE